MHQRRYGKTLPDLLRRFGSDETAATAIEYALVAGIMAVAVFGFRNLFEALQSGLFDVAESAVSDATSD